MNRVESVSVRVSLLIDRVRAGDDKARLQLIEHAGERLRRLVAQQMRRFPAVARWEQTDDVWQAVLIRLSKALRDVPLTDAKHFFSLASLQIRRELMDLKRKHHGPEGVGAHHASVARSGDSSAGAGPEAKGRERSPQTIAEWGELHGLVNQLEPELRDVVDLLWYQGLEQEEAASLLGVSSKTVNRRWREARIRLGELLAS